MQLLKYTGFKQRSYNIPTKRYCQTLELKDNPELINEYIKRHSLDESWPEIRDGIKQIGILEMEIYIFKTHLFMIVETPIDFEWDKAFAKLATLPRQQEWEEYMSAFQITATGATSAEKWKMMERIFYIYD